MSIRSCNERLCGVGGSLCINCLLGVSSDAAEFPSPECRNTLAWMRGEEGATPPPGCEWGPVQRFTAADLAPLTPEEIAAAETGDQAAALEWASLADEATELERRRVELESDQDFLADSWIRIQADREAHAAARGELIAERQQLRRTRRLQGAAAGVLTLWTISLLEHSGIPAGAVFLISLAAFAALGWRFWGRAWVEGRTQ